MSQELTTFTEASQELDVFPGTITDLVRAYDIKPKRLKASKAKGLDAADMRLLRRVLRRDRKGAAAPA